MGVVPSQDKSPDHAYSLDLLKEVFPEDLLGIALPQGDATAIVRPEALKRVMEFLRNDPRTDFNFLVDITCVDYFGKRPRFEVVYHLLSLRYWRRLRVKARLDAEDPRIESLTSLWGSADWLEREAWDMFGVRFVGHPNLRRLLMYEEFQGHPLRRDYPIQKRQPLIGPKT